MLRLLVGGPSLRRLGGDRRALVARVVQAADVREADQAEHERDSRVQGAVGEHRGGRGGHRHPVQDEHADQAAPALPGMGTIAPPWPSVYASTSRPIGRPADPTAWKAAASAATSKAKYPIAPAI